MELLGVFATMTLFGGVLWFWLSVVVFLTICIASDVNENGFYAFGTLVVFVIVFNFWGDISPLLGFITVKNILMYIGVGFLYATLRTFVSSKKLKKLLKTLPEEKPSEYPYTTKQDAKNDFKKELGGNVFRWWFMWVINALVWLFKDLIGMGWDYVYSKVKFYFNWIVDLGLK